MTARRTLILAAAAFTSAAPVLHGTPQNQSGHGTCWLKGCKPPVEHEWCTETSHMADGFCTQSELNCQKDCNGQWSPPGPAPVPASTSRFVVPKQYGCPSTDPEAPYLCNQTIMKLAGPPALSATASQCLSFITIDFDGTIEADNKLAHDVFSEATEIEKRTSLIEPYQRVKQAAGGVNGLVDKYFNGKTRVDSLRTGLEEARRQMGGNVVMLSASWDPTPANVWSAYLLQVLTDLKLGFDEEHINAVDDPGPGISADKGNKFVDIAKNIHAEVKRGVHCDDGWKYPVQVMSHGGNGLHIGPLQGVDLLYLASISCP